MSEEEVQLWHYLDEAGEQQGPVTADELQELATAGTIHPETEVWTEGLDQWVPATHVEGLLPQPQPEPETHRPHLVTGHVNPQAAAHPIEPAYHVPTATSHPVKGVVVPGPAAQSAAQPNPIAAGLGAPPTGYPGAEEGHYPPTPSKGASFGKMVTFLIGGFVLLFGGPLVGGMLGVAGASAGAPGAPGGGPEEVPMAAVALILIGYFGGLLLLLIGEILALIYLYRAWDLLKWGTPRTTPGKAVGFLFIPFFNLYWIFVAHWGLAEDWNRTMASYPDLQAAPRISSGMALAACICTLLAGPVGFVLLLVHYAQVCGGINFMAARAMHQTRAGGIHLY